MDAHAEEAIDSLDAAVLSGDAFFQADARKALREAMARWERVLKSYEEEPDGV